MPSPAANPSQNSAQIEQEKHFGPPVLGKKLFKAKAKAFNNSSFRTLPKNIDISTDKKVRDEIEKYINAALNEEYVYGYNSDADSSWFLYDTLSDYQKEDFDENIHSERDDWKVELTTIGGPEGHKVYFIEYQSNGSDVKEVYVNDIQYQALLRKYEQIVPTPKLYHTCVSTKEIRW